MNLFILLAQNNSLCTQTCQNTECFLVIYIFKCICDKYFAFQSMLHIYNLMHFQKILDLLKFNSYLIIKWK